MLFMSRSFSVLMVLAAFAVATLGGCNRGPKMYPVTGQVLSSGKPVAGASVLFYREKAARPPAGTTNASGEFQFLAPAGDYTAVITACESLSPQAGMGVTDEDPNKVRWTVPQKYSRADESDLKVTVKSSDNQFKFEFPRK
jgi:hypothetical protein